MEWLESLDRSLFLFLNGFHHSWLDVFFSYVGLVGTWIPLYVVILLVLIRRFKKKIWLNLLMVAFLVLATDQSSVALKNSVQRFRPSHNIEIRERVHVLNDERGGKFGFVSSHAANMWGIAIFVFMTLRPTRKFSVFLLFAWASLVSYGRIYAGVHYPADVAAGAILGIALGLIFYNVQAKLLQKFENENNSPTSI